MYLIAEDGPHKGLVLNLEDGDEWIIGRDPDAAVFVLEDSTVSRKHARLTKKPDGIFLKNLSRVNPTLVNDEEHSEQLMLKDGDRIQIGNTTFIYKQGEEEHKTPYDNIFGDLEMPKEPEPPSNAESVYDTIFEEGPPVEAPFHLAAETPLILKVIAGPNAGAEIGVEKGKSYVMGKDPNSSDIVFNDMSVSRNHARLSVSSDGEMEIEDLGSKNGTVVNGTVIDARRMITPQDLVALGTTVFMIIDREAPQETIYSSAMSTFETGKEATAEMAVSKEESKDWKKEPVPSKYLIIAGSFAAIFLIAFLSFFSLFKPEGMEVAHKEHVSEIKDALDKFNDVQFSYNPGSGKLFLSGHVLTQVDYQEMQYRISQIPFIVSTEDNVVVDEGVWRSMNDVISQNEGWKGVSIYSPAAGKFVVNGYVTAPQQATALTEYLTVNFPYLDRLQNKVVIEQVLDTELQGLIAAESFGAVAVQLANGEVILTGRYSDEKKHEYERLLKKINGLNGVRSVKDFAVATHPSMARIDLTANYLVTGSTMVDHHGYNVVINGKIYAVGDHVDGMSITQINASAILLEKDGLKYKIDTMR